MSKADKSRDREVFDLLRAIRESSNREIAERAGISASTIANWRRPINEGGTRHPQFYTMQRVARAAGMAFQLQPLPGKKS